MVADRIYGIRYGVRCYFTLNVLREICNKSKAKKNTKAGTQFGNVGVVLAARLLLFIIIKYPKLSKNNSQTLTIYIIITAKVHITSQNAQEYNIITCRKQRVASREPRRNRQRARPPHARNKYIIYDNNTAKYDDKHKHNGNSDSDTPRPTLRRYKNLKRNKKHECRKNVRAVVNVYVSGCRPCALVVSRAGPRYPAACSAAHARRLHAPPPDPDPDDPCLW